ncbi:hypothetical protein PR048_009962 [Dryococelus australis]|uniref:Uncharacterized protein n=1 Tax=Dryococelus australis TaxID=614101 RepID=A0ABQ9I392_9NEOP|nr:hypothetical protein PR048_009962 [Dryococelus australis]
MTTTHRLLPQSQLHRYLPLFQITSHYHLLRDRVDLYASSIVFRAIFHCVSITGRREVVDTPPQAARRVRVCNARLTPRSRPEVRERTSAAMCVWPVCLCVCARACAYFDTPGRKAQHCIRQQRPGWLRGDPGSIPDRITGFSHVGIVLDDAVGWRVFSGISRFPCHFNPVPLHTHLNYQRRLSRPLCLKPPKSLHSLTNSLPAGRQSERELRNAAAMYRALEYFERVYSGIDANTTRCSSEETEYRRADSPSRIFANIFRPVICLYCVVGWPALVVMEQDRVESGREVSGLHLSSTAVMPATDVCKSAEHVPIRQSEERMQRSGKGQSPEKTHRVMAASTTFRTCFNNPGESNQDSKPVTNGRTPRQSRRESDKTALTLTRIFHQPFKSTVTPTKSQPQQPDKSTQHLSDGNCRGIVNTELILVAEIVGLKRRVGLPGRARRDMDLI